MPPRPDAVPAASPERILPKPSAVAIAHFNQGAEGQFLLTEGPFCVGDCILYELLDAHGVWQWRVARLIMIDEHNERVGFGIPLAPPALSSMSPDPSDSAHVVPQLSRDKQGVASDALDALARANDAAMARQRELFSIASELHAERAAIDAMSAELSRELAVVEPLLEGARDAVGKISQVDLSEMRSYRTPPPIVMRVLEAVKIILEGVVPRAEIQWKDVSQFCKNNEFVARVRDFDSEMSPSTHQYLVRTFVEDTAFSAEAATRASAAAGPLYQWVMAQVDAAIVRSRVAPLTRRYKEAQQHAASNAERQAAVVRDQQRVSEDVRTSTLAYQRAVFGFDFVALGGKGSGAKSSPSQFPSGARQLAIDAANRQRPALWVPSSVEKPTRLLMSSIMACLR